MNNYEIIKKETREFYKSIGSITCPVLDNEEIYFTSKGFEHLVRKGKILRSTGDQMRRFRLLLNVEKILQETDLVLTVRKEETAHFYKLSKVINKQEISIIIRQLHHGPKHFFSIMARKSSTKNTLE